MKKTMLTILLCGVMIMGITGCKKEELKGDSISNLFSKNDEVEKLKKDNMIDLFPGKDIVPGEANYYYIFTGKSDYIF